MPKWIMKYCKWCKKDKESTEFNRNNKHKDGLQNICRVCTKEHAKIQYQNNKEYRKLKTKQRRADTLAWIREFKKDLVCEKCSEDHPAVLDFHHKDQSKKDFSISYACKMGYSRERILEEIKKCNVWCSNCHRKHHWEENHE